MNTIDTWLDTAEVRRLADRLIHPVLHPNIAVADIGFDDGFEGFSGPDPAPTSAEPPTHSEPSPAQSNAAMANSTPPLAVIRPTPPIESSATGSERQRLQSFCDRLKREYSASGIFLIDQNGEVVFDESKHGRFHFLAKNLAATSGKSASSASSIRLKTSAVDFLEVIPAVTPSGCLVLGAQLPKALTLANVADIRSSLTELAMHR